MNRGMETRHDLEVLLVIDVLALGGDDGALGLALLLLLADLDPVLGGEVLPELGEGVGRLAEALEERAVEGVEDDVVVGPAEGGGCDGVSSSSFQFGGRKDRRWGMS